MTVFHTFHINRTCNLRKHLLYILRSSNSEADSDDRDINGVSCMMTDDHEFLRYDIDTSSIMRYSAATNTQAVFVNRTVFVHVSICKPLRTDQSAPQVAYSMYTRPMQREQTSPTSESVRDPIRSTSKI